MNNSSEQENEIIKINHKKFKKNKLFSSKKSIIIITFLIINSFVYNNDY